MGLIKALFGAVGGGLADQWLEVYEAGEMNDTTVLTKGLPVRKDDKRSSNTKGSAKAISDGSIIQVYPNQFMMLTDGGKIVDYTAEPGYYKVDNNAIPSLFNGQFGAAFKETFARFKYGGTAPTSQQVFFVNLKEIRGIKFGTPNPVNYFDNFYNAELYLRTFGSYSIKIVDPMKFFIETLSYSKDSIDINDINEQYQNEFLSALQAALNQMSADGARISHVASKSMELGKYMANILDEDWTNTRGMEIQAVGIANISYDDESKKLLAIRSEGAMLGDATVREGYVQGSIARGIEAAGSNAGGSMAGFMGVGMGLNQTGGFMGAASETNRQQMQQQPQQSAPTADAQGWTCACGVSNNGNFCQSCGGARPVSNEWVCACGAKSSGKFCSECGKAMPVEAVCEGCGFKFEPGTTPKFCPECGKQM